MTRLGDGEPVTLDEPAGDGQARTVAATLALSLATRRPVEWRRAEAQEVPSRAASPGESPALQADVGSPTGRDSIGHGLDAGVASRPAVALAQAVATAVGARVDGQLATFEPMPVRPGRRTVTCPPGVSAVLVLESLMWPLALAQGTSELSVFGATHVARVPSFHDLALGLFPAAERLGVAGEVALQAAGFAPEGGGQLRARIYSAPKLQAADWTHRGVLREVRAYACVANLGIGIARPLAQRLSERLRSRGVAAQVEVLPMPATRGRGLCVVVAAEFERVRSVFTSVGEAGKPGGEVVDEAVAGLCRLLERRGALPPLLAEQLLVPAALAASRFGAPGALPASRERRPSRLSVSEVTWELLQVARAARALCEVEIQVQGLPGEEGLVEVRP